MLSKISTSLASLALGLLGCGALMAQTAPYTPDYLLLGGVSYNAFSKKPAATTTFAVHLTGNTYNITSTDIGTAMGNSTASVRSGVMQILYRRGNLALLGCGQAGVVTDGSVNLATYAECGGIVYDIGAKLKKDHFYIAVHAIQTQISGVENKPVYALSFGKAF